MMGAPKGRPRPAGSGRKKGTHNRVTAAAKWAIEQAAEELGGVARLVAWAREDPANERIFWSMIYPKLLPVQAVEVEVVPAAPRPAMTLDEFYGGVGGSLPN